MAFPSTPLDVTVELYYDSTWNNITAYVYHRDLIRIRRGMSNEAVRADPQTCRLTLNNRDGRFSIRNSLGALYGKITRNTPLRITVNPGTGNDVRFTGEVAKWPSRWDVSGADVWVPIEAAGSTRRLGQGGSLRSAVFRSMSGVAPGDYVPYAYWPMEDGTSATQFASYLASGPPGKFSGTVSPGSSTTPAGSEPLPTFGLNATVKFRVPTYVNTDQWVVQFVANIPASPTADPQLLAEFMTPNGTIGYWTLTIEDESPDPDALYLRGYSDPGGSALFAAGTAITHGGIGSADGFYGHTFMFTVATYQSGTSVYGWIDGVREDQVGMEPALGTAASSTHGALAGNITLTSPIADTVMGHLAVYIDPNFTITYGGSDADVNAAALNGYAAEVGGRRIERLCREESIQFTSVGDLDTTAAMGPQPIGSLLELLDDCAQVDGGIIYEPRDSLGIAYRTRVSRYNQAVALALDYGADGHISPPLDPIEDDQGVVNDATITREGGSSGRYELTAGSMSTQDPPDGIGRYELTETHNLYDDSQPAQHAGWLVNVSAVDEERYPTIRVNARAAALHSEAVVVAGVAAIDVGDRLTVANPPVWQPPGPIDQNALGYEETIGHFDWDFTFNCSPSAPWSVMQLNSSEYGRLASGGCELAVAVNTTATSLVAVTDSGGRPWVSDPMHWTYVASTFSGTASSGWAALTTGETWTTTGGSASDYSESGGYGRVALGSVNVSRWTTTAMTHADQYVYATVSTDVLALGGSHYPALTCRWQDSSNNYLARVAMQTDQGITLSIRKRVAGVETELAAVLLADTHTAGGRIAVKLQVVGSVLRAKAWAVTNQEPLWLLAVEDTSISAAGSAGMRSTLSSTNTNTLPVNVTWDDFRVGHGLLYVALGGEKVQVTNVTGDVSPQTLTVVRSINGVVKSHAVGTRVQLEKAVLAL